MTRAVGQRVDGLSVEILSRRWRCDSPLALLELANETAYTPSPAGMVPEDSSIPVLDLSWANDPSLKPQLLSQLHSALFDVGFLYIKNHGIPSSTISALTSRLPALFDLPGEERAALSKLNSPHFLGYSGFAEETTLGKQDLREQFDFATELPVVWREPGQAGEGNGEGRDFSKLYWRLRGPNQWPDESALPGFRKAFVEYHDAVQVLSYGFVHLIEEALGIEVGTFDCFFGQHGVNGGVATSAGAGGTAARTFLPPQHRIKLLKYPPTPPSIASSGLQGVGAHKDSSGWLTFLYQVGTGPGLEVLSSSNTWIPAHPVPDTFVVNFGNAFEAATEGAVKATTHRVVAPGPDSATRYSIPFFQGLPLDMTVSEVREYIPEHVRSMRGKVSGVQSESEGFLDPRWDSLGESQLRKWVRSHRDVAEKWYGKDVLEYYTS
jgi:isopenicillin N synthase-like dioxygenase